MQIIRLPEVIRITQLSRPTVYRLMKSNQFPGRRQLGIKSVGWSLDEIQDWLENRPMVE